jgi:hypothetical protein
LEPGDIYFLMKEAKAEMDRAQGQMVQQGNDNEGYRKFIEARQRYWELAEKWLTKFDEKWNELG